ncbi:MAG: hypothetical protein J5716_02075 [Alphaproteobacteria bacterium]|nr:hypothetical protein [Alphaproteobacteria bacterium]
MGFLFRLLNRSKIKRYDHIVSLGYNCEIAYQLFRHNGFLESNLFAWASIPSLQTLISALNDLNQIGSQDYVPDDIMYICNKTKIKFHGKTDLKKFGNDPELVRKDKEELYSRVAFLRDKFISVAEENSRKLYILKVKSSETDVEQKIDEIRGLLSRRNNGSFDFLFVPEEAFAKTLSLTEKDGFYIRTVSEYAPDSAVTSKFRSFKEWQRIFDEFVPLHKLKKTKKYKFEEVEQ